MRILLVNPAYDADHDPEAQLDRYDTLTGWGEALLAAGAAEVTTLQRFSRNVDLERGGVRYRFRADGGGPRPGPWTRPRGLSSAARESRSNLVHANGLVFPGLLWQLRRAMPASVPMVVQHHAGGPPPAGGMRSALRRAVWRLGLAGADAFFFTAEEQARPWREARVIRPAQEVHAIPESSRSPRRVPRQEARERSGVAGQPALLWVGRLSPQKDPLTVLEGFARVSDALPAARLTFVYQDDRLLPELRARVAADARLGERVRLASPVPPDAVPYFLCAADVFVLGSPDEGSGYALIEALACGLVPVVTDIPSFRALTSGGRLGALWAPGDAGALARSLVAVAGRPIEPQRDAVIRHFEAELSWAAVGRRAMALYRQVLEARRR